MILSNTKILLTLAVGGLCVFGDLLYFEDLRSMHTYSLLELNTYIKQVVALNFEDPVWITCEISQARNSRGQLYLELVQQNEAETDIVATASATIWYKNHLFIKKKLGDLYDAILKDGTQVSLKIQVSFHERYGLKLNILDVDPSYTIGQLEMQRQQVIERLRKAGVLQINEQLPLPTVLQRVAVVSSERAAGYKDFLHQLEHNAYGYRFHTTLYHVAVQGVNVEAEVSDAFAQIESISDQYDCIVVIRGGGSRLDLAAFDNYNIGHKIATCLLPVLTGIGHEIDNSVADIVAHTSVKTPTAAADMLIEHNLHFESMVVDMVQNISGHAQHTVQRMHQDLDRQAELVQIHSRQLVKDQSRDLDVTLDLIGALAKDQLLDMNQQVHHIEEIVSILDPKHVLKRGFAILNKDEDFVTSVKDASSGDAISITLDDGTLTTVVQ